MGTWTRVEGPYTGYAGNDLEIWTGMVSTTGASTITVAYSSSVTAIYTGLASKSSRRRRDRRRPGVSTPGQGSPTPRRPRSPSPSSPRPGPASSTSATGRWPTPVRRGPPRASPTRPPPMPMSSAWNTNISAAVQPTATQAPAGVSGAVAVLITASGTTRCPPTVTAVSPERPARRRGGPRSPSPAPTSPGSRP